jgi:hypothetical protein
MSAVDQSQSCAPVFRTADSKYSAIDRRFSPR